MRKRKGEAKAADPLFEVEVEGEGEEEDKRDDETEGGRGEKGREAARDDERLIRVEELVFVVDPMDEDKEGEREEVEKVGDVDKEDEGKDDGDCKMLGEEEE